MKKKFFMSLFVFLSLSTASYAVEKQNLMLMNNKGENSQKINKILNTPIQGKSSSEIISNIEALVKNLNGAEKIGKVIRSDIEAFTAKQTYLAVKKNPNKTLKELKSIISNGAEMEAVEYFNGKTISELMKDNIRILRMKEEYLSKYENLISKKKIDFSFLNKYIRASTENELRLELRKIYSNINNPEIQDIVKEAFVIILEKSKFPRGERYLSFADKTVREIILEASRLDPDFRKRFLKVSGK